MYALELSNVRIAGDRYEYITIYLPTQPTCPPIQVEIWFFKSKDLEKQEVAMNKKMADERAAMMVEKSNMKSLSGGSAELSKKKAAL